LNDAWVADEIACIRPGRPRSNIQLLVAIEQEFSVRFNTGEVAGLANVGDMVSLIVNKLAGAGRP